jgi:phosphoglycolate phosphatase-like HAD superfamily hydrolase
MSRLSALDASADWGHDGFAWKAFGGRIRVAQIHHMLQELRKRDVECLVLSNGMVGPIRDCLKRVNLLAYFSDVVANTGFSMGTTDYDNSFRLATDVPGTPRVGQKITKCDYLRTWLKDKSLNARQVVFIDDETRTVGSAQSICRTIHVASDSGMQEKELQLLQSMLQ